jgi:two-component sensor histidine kinase
VAAFRALPGGSRGCAPFLCAGGERLQPGPVEDRNPVRGPERTAFLGRLSSLAQAHSLLTAAGWEAADLATLVRQELSAYPPHRAVCSGPPLGLSPRTAQTLALVLHELGTNAAKYGALSVHAGKIEVVWCLTQCPEPVLELTWCESGGPCVSPPARGGHGTRLIERSVLAQGGEVKLDYRSEGLFARLRLPDWNHNRT